MNADNAARFHMQRSRSTLITTGPGYAAFFLPWYRPHPVGPEHRLPVGTSEAYLATVRCRVGCPEIRATARVCLSLGDLAHVSVWPPENRLLYARDVVVDKVVLHSARPEEPAFPITGRSPMTTLPAAPGEAAEWLRGWRERGQLRGLQAPVPDDVRNLAGQLGITFPEPYLDLMSCTAGFVLGHARINDLWHAHERVNTEGVTVCLAIRADHSSLDLDEIRRQLLIDGSPVASTRSLGFQEFAQVLEGFAFSEITWMKGR